MSDPVSGRVFISYRRQETSGMAGRLYDRLAAHFGDDHVFMDVDRVIPILVEGAVMPRRRDLPDNLASLARRNALIVRHESFRSDADRLVAAIEPVLRAAAAPPASSAARDRAHQGSEAPRRLRRSEAPTRRAMATSRVLVDRYEVGRLVGDDGMAEVYEGHDRLLARRVAIKVLLAQYAHDPAFLARFRREAQIAASLSHPNIVATLDTGSQGDTWFIVMEYVAGRTLKDVIRTEGALDWAWAAEIAADVAGALSAVHARGVVHRDVKPGNVMLTTDGKVKVTGFGIARASAVPSITQTAAVVGTAQYIAPEQAQGLEVDARSDLYALGCCLYEMLTGQVPFTGSTPVAIAYRHVREDPTPPRSLDPDIPAPLEVICLKAMAKRPEDRYQTALEMRQDLEDFRNARPRR